MNLDRAQILQAKEMVRWAYNSKWDHGIVLGVTVHKSLLGVELVKEGVASAVRYTWYSAIASHLWNVKRLPASGRSSYP